ncbi:MAG: ROK family transcriptional regulator [Sphaerochaetaceae bacterium]
MDRLKLTSAVNANLQNTINTSLILNLIRTLGTTYRYEISKALNLSLPAVSRSVDQLLQLGYLKEKKIITKHGRQAHQIEINAKLGISIGISIELPKLKFAKMDMAGRIISVQEVNLHTANENLELLVLKYLKEFLQSKEVTDDLEIPIIAFTIGIPAAVDTNHNKIHAILYSNLKELDLKRLIEEIYSVPVFLENNENLAVVAEKHYQDPIPEENYVYITIHHGIGAGIFSNGELHRGFNGAAGEIGYQHIATGGFGAGSENKKFESTGSLYQIQQIALDIIHAGKGEEIFQAANYSYNNVTHTLIGEMANTGNRIAVEILASYAKLLAVGIGNILVVLNPELVIFGGNLLDIQHSDRFILEPMKKQLETMIPFPIPEFRLTRLGYETSVIGACQMGLEQTLLRTFPYNI